MRFIILRKADQTTEMGVMPSHDMLAVMSNYLEEMGKAGVLLSAEGFQPSSKGARVKFSHGKPKATNGPFDKPDGLVAGYCLIQVKSKDEAIEWAKRWPALDSGGEVELELLQVHEVEDFGEDFTAELREKEERLRRQIAKKE